MKRTWVVYIEQGIGHDLNNTISDTEWYGPYTQAQAEQIEAELNAILDTSVDIEHPVARSMMLDYSPLRELKRHVRETMVETEPVED